MRLALSVFFLLSSGALAESKMSSLETVLSGQPEKSYVYVRCASFYLANVEWAGQALSEEVFEQSKANIADLLLIATLTRSEHSSDGVQHLSEMVNLDARQIADFYLENYRQEYALTGTAWEGNKVWNSDAATCKPISEAASTVVAEIRGN